MPAFSYQALDAQGGTQSGVVEADSSRAARNQLRAQSLVPLNLTALGTSSSDIIELTSSVNFILLFFI